MTPAERNACIDRYAAGPALLEAAFTKFPVEARQWRPAPGKWSAHEIIVHCADSEVNSHGRIRYLVSEKDPLIVGYDQDAWARDQDYHAHPLDLAFATVSVVRANTVPLLRRLTEAQWKKVGRHSESGTYSAETWLTTYAEHLEVHVRQLGRVLGAWETRKA